MSEIDCRPQQSNILYWRNVANEGRGSQMTQCLHEACDYAAKLEAENAELRAKIHEDNVILEGLRQDHAAIHDLFRRTTGYTATDYIIMREEIKDAPRSNREWRLLAAQEKARAEKEVSESAELRDYLERLLDCLGDGLPNDAEIEGRALLAKVSA